MKLAEIFSDKSPYELRINRLIGRVMADYVYSAGGVFFKRGVDQKIDVSSTYRKQDDSENIRVCTFRYDGRWYVLALDGSFTMSTAGSYDTVNSYFLETPSSIEVADEVLPDLLTRGVNIDGIEVHTVKNGGNFEAPSYYTDMFVRTDGIEHYDPEHAVDPLKVNPPPDVSGRRRLVPYDDDGNPVLAPVASSPVDDVPRTMNWMRAEQTVRIMVNTDRLELELPDEYEEADDDELE